MLKTVNNRCKYLGNSSRTYKIDFQMMPYINTALEKLVF